jgi:CheY-like chemotaxis protein
MDDQEIFVAAVSEVSDTINCITLSNARLALEKLMGKDLSPDVIFLDLNMPVMNGQQFLVEVKKNALLKNIPINIFSTSSNPATREIMKDLGASDFITKPDNYNVLVNLLKKIL